MHITIQLDRALFKGSVSGRVWFTNFSEFLKLFRPGRACSTVHSGAGIRREGTHIITFVFALESLSGKIQ